MDIFCENYHDEETTSPPNVQRWLKKKVTAEIKQADNLLLLLPDLKKPLALRRLLITNPCFGFIKQSYFFTHAIVKRSDSEEARAPFLVGRSLVRGPSLYEVVTQRRGFRFSASDFQVQIYVNKIFFD